MKTELFDFDLPEALIALAPATPRDAARMLVVGPGDALSHQGVRDLPGHLRPGDVLVVNDSRVIPARLSGRRGEAKIEITLHKREADDLWRAFAKNAKRLKAGDRIDFADDFAAEVLEKHEGGEVLLRLDADDPMAALGRYGVMPLPPYIASKRAVDAGDDQRYQTVYARRPGAVAAPTAGLHFTRELLDAVKTRGVTVETVTLHVGAGTFLPVKVSDTDDHKMHAEYGEVPAEVAARLNAARAQGGRIVAAGTTALRLLESAADDAGRIHGFAGDTAIFITPGYRFRAVDLLLTNFHLPKSTLFMLVSAFAGMARMRAAYQAAIDARYRFYSYGDATLLYPGFPEKCPA